MRVIILFFTLISCYCKSQDTIVVFSVSNRHKAIVHYPIDKLKSSKDTIFLVKKSRSSFSESEAIKRKEWDLVFDEIIDRTTVFKVYFKDELVEICSGNTEYYIGNYKFFHKGRIILIEGQFNFDGEKVGTWKFYNRRGKLKSIINY